MTVSITNRPAPWWLRELAHGRAAYEELLGWPVSVQVGNRVLVLTTNRSLSAITMPATLGALVRDELALALQRAPVVSDPDGLRWTFLTRPPEGLRAGTAADLARSRVTLLPHQGQVTVPTAPTAEPPGAPAGRRVARTWRWVEAPTPSRQLPPAYPVIAVARRLTERAHLALGA